MPAHFFILHSSFCIPCVVGSCSISYFWESSYLPPSSTFLISSLDRPWIAYTNSSISRSNALTSAPASRYFATKMRATRRSTGFCSSGGAAGIGKEESSGNEFRIQRVAFLEFAHAHDAEADDLPLRVHALHDGVMFGYLFVASGVGKTDFQEIPLRVEPDSYFIGLHAGWGMVSNATRNGCAALAE